MDKGFVPRPPALAAALGALGLLLASGCARDPSPPPPGPSSPVSSAGPASGRRLTKTEYANTVADLLGVALDADDLGMLPDDQPATGGGFRNDIAGLLPSAVRTNAYETLALRIADRMPWDGGLATHAGCADDTAECREGFIRRLGRLMYRRPLTDADVANLVPLFGAAGSEANAFEIGARLVLEAMLQSPYFLYRLERIDAARPGPFEMATRLSYLLWSSAPTPALLDAAERGDLSERGALGGVVNDMLADPRARRGFEAYVQDWLQLYRLDARTPNAALGVSAALLAEMKQQTLGFLDRIAFTEGRELADLFTDQKTELGPALAEVYGLPPPEQEFAEYDLAGDSHRLGLLTQPGFLILRAAPARVSIVHRGLMVMRVFLCNEVPPPPPGVAAQIDSIPTNLTDRDRFALHTAAPECAGCHDAFDPLGYPFEPFDLAGRWRSEDEYGNPLRSDGQVMLDGALQSYQDAAEFAGLLARSPEVARCFARKMLQYGLGRALGAADGAAVDDLWTRFQDGGRTYAAAITALATSPALSAGGANP